jgi:nucleotide-binding universal stress UspA family protein
MVMKAERILVPLDGTSFAETALPRAVELLSDGPRATLILLRATGVTTLPGVDPVDAQVAVVRDAESYLTAVADRLNEQGVTRVVRSVWYSSPAKAIVEAAQMRRANLIVMSTHARRGLRRALRGSVAESVLRQTRTPMLLVSADGALEPGRAGDAAGEHLAGEPLMSSAGPLGPAIAVEAQRRQGG